MNRTILIVAGALLAVPGALSAQSPFRGPNEGSGIQTRVGNPSPDGGFSALQTNSRIDDYFNQDDQININPDTGVVKVLRVNEKNLINDFVTAVFPIENVFPREVRNVMRTVTGKEGGRAEVIRDKTNNRAYVQVICPKFQLPWIQQAVAALDVDWLEQARDGSVSGRYYTKYRPAISIDAFASLYAGEGATQVDFNNSMVLRRDEPYRVESYLKAAETIDIPSPQALLKFMIYEVDTNNDLKLGVDWIAWKNGPGRSLFELIWTGQNSHHRYDNATGFFDPNLGAFTVLTPGNHNSFNLNSTQHLLSANYLLTSAYLDFLRVKGKARVLAEPEIFVLTGVPATWNAVDQFLAFEATPAEPNAFGIVPQRLNKTTVSEYSIYDPSAFTTNSDFAAHNRFLSHGIRGELGIFLEVTAVIGTESSEVEIELESTDLAGTTPQGTPIITSRHIVTKIRLVDGQPFVFGGLTRDEDVAANNKAPWLGDIPIIGYLFGQETSSARRKELVITCVPHFYQGCPKEVTDPLEVDTIAMATGEKEIVMPENCFGFDQWLFDTVEHPKE